MTNGIKIREIRILQIFYDIVNSLWCSKSADLSSVVPELNYIASYGPFDIFEW